MSFPPRLALSASALELRGYIAHELQHVAQQDHRKGHPGRVFPATTLLLTPIVLVVVVGFSILTGYAPAVSQDWYCS